MTAKAQVLMQMDRADLLAFVGLRLRGDRFPPTAKQVDYLAGIRADRGIRTERCIELMAHRWPRLPLMTFARILERVELERARWEAATRLLGPRLAPVDLTPESAQRLAQLLDSWSRPAEASSTAGLEGDRSRLSERAQQSTLLIPRGTLHQYSDPPPVSAQQDTTP